MLRKIIRETVGLLKKIAGKDNSFQYQLFKLKLRHAKALKNLKNKEVINVCFFLILDSVWKCDDLYEFLKKDPRFNPLVLVCPYTVYGEENMIYEMDRAYASFKNKGYNVMKSLKSDGTWVNVREELKPDIIFFTNPHNLTKPQYYIYNFKDHLTCYVPYGIMAANLQPTQFDQDFHNLIWKCFCETSVHKSMAMKYARNKGKNVVITGYPGCDVFVGKESESKINPWKDQPGLKLIWAPHHTIEDDPNQLAYSNFLTQSELFLSLLEKYNNKIQIAFKPHPILKSKLYAYKDWGKAKTDDYYAKWGNSKNGLLVEGGYEDLFLTSDAMVFDSLSFMTEYLFLNKPSLFMVRDKTIASKFNEFGKMVFDLLYKGNDWSDVIRFIEDRIHNTADENLKKQKEFIDKILLPPNTKTASENIYNYLKQQLT